MQGSGSPMVSASDHGRHIMSSSPVPIKTRRVGQRCTLNLSRAETSSRCLSDQSLSPTNLGPVDEEMVPSSILTVFGCPFFSLETFPVAQKASSHIKTRFRSGTRPQRGILK
ncbi:hypothetical protein TNCV_1823551 [Trichonephila clavipes]|nr:hypothetical protein TNCV_1823551 [Trichonephila clavipes]